MKINVTVPHSMHLAAMTQDWEYQLDGPAVGRAMQVADELGFNKCMLGEHFVIPSNHLELSGAHYFHTPVALGYFAGRTKKLKLSSSLTILPLQNPLIHAKAWSTLDWLSGGRAEVMFGVGWLEEEFQALDVPFHERGRMADEYLTVIRDVWTQEISSFEGKYVNYKDMHFAPKPIQTPLPIWLGGDAEAVLKRVAKFANGWCPFRTPPEKFPACIDTIKSQPTYDGRPLGVTFAMEMLNIGAQHEILDDPRAPGSKDAPKIIDTIGWLADLGVTETVVALPPKLPGFEAYLDHLAWIAAEIIPKVG